MSSDGLFLDEPPAGTRLEFVYNDVIYGIFRDVNWHVYGMAGEYNWLDILNMFGNSLLSSMSLVVDSGI